MTENQIDKVFLVNMILAGNQTLIGAIESESAKRLLKPEDLRRLKAAIRTIQDVQVNL